MSIAGSLLAGTPPNSDPWPDFSRRHDHLDRTSTFSIPIALRRCSSGRQCLSGVEKKLRVVLRPRHFSESFLTLAHKSQGISLCFT